MNRIFRHRRAVPQLLIFAIAALLASGVAFAKKQFVPPAVQPVRSYPAHDEHTDEKVTIAADPYDSAPKADIFSIKWAGHDMLPIFVVISNDGDQPISLNNMQVQFITVQGGKREKIESATNDDIYRRLSNPKDPQRRIPLPIPAGRAKGSVSHDQLDEIDRAQFAARAVEPHATQSGFFFFDITDAPRPLPGSRVYITGIRSSKAQELFYFEIRLDKASQ